MKCNIWNNKNNNNILKKKKRKLQINHSSSLTHLFSECSRRKVKTLTVLLYLPERVDTAKLILALTINGLLVRTKPDLHTSVLGFPLHNLSLLLTFCSDKAHL